MNRLIVLLSTLVEKLENYFLLEKYALLSGGLFSYFEKT